MNSHRSNNAQLVTIAIGSATITIVYFLNVDFSLSGFTTGIGEADVGDGNGIRGWAFRT